MYVYFGLSHTYFKGLQYLIRSNISWLKNAACSIFTACFLYSFPHPSFEFYKVSETILLAYLSSLLAWL